MREAEVVTPSPSVPPEKSSPTRWRRFRAIRHRALLFGSLTRGPLLSAAAAAREPELGYTVLGCVRAQSWAA